VIEFEEILPRKIVNIHRHVDGPWFWDKYSAHPYIGCRSGCLFCYLRGGRYLGRRDPSTFDTLIQIKANAAELLRKELGRLEKDIILCGDWQQPAEDRYRLSRSMLEVIDDLGFPLFVVERSPLIARDLDLLRSINSRAWVGVVFSLSGLDGPAKQAFEPRSPGVKRRLQAMSALASDGITVGAALMPILPGVGDQPAELEVALRAVRDHGGTFALGGGLTMEGVQAEITLTAARTLDPGLEKSWRRLYQWEDTGRPQYSPDRVYSAGLGRTVRELCDRVGLKDRMARYIPAGSLAVNKRIAEKLFLKTYDLELEMAEASRIWAYRRAAWTIDEHPISVEVVYREGGEPALRELPAIGPRLAGQIALWLQQARPGVDP
jgi:DNA repair photolyase